MSEGLHVMRVEIGTTATAKPLVGGQSHAVAAILAVLGTVKLLQLTAGDPPKQLTMLIYGVSAILLFTVSALYHMGPLVAAPARPPAPARPRGHLRADRRELHADCV